MKSQQFPQGVENMTPASMPTLRLIAGSFSEEWSRFLHYALH
ncbi:MAG TPA: hypothetical protein VJU83_07075 [Burkholderiales bacterium]|nr:hypothetical protein [Burkholderiales bacterium]